MKRSLSEDEDKLSCGEVPRLLLNWNKGDPAALDRLATLVYEELRRMAHQRLRRERIGHAAHTGTLVQEVYLRLIEANDVECQSPEEFFRIAARLKRHVLMDFARKRHAIKRGGSRGKVQDQRANNDCYETFVRHFLFTFTLADMPRSLFSIACGNASAMPPRSAIWLGLITGPADLCFNISSQ